MKLQTKSFLTTWGEMYPHLSLLKYVSSEIASNIYNQAFSRFEKAYLLHEIGEQATSN